MRQFYKNIIVFVLYFAIALVGLIYADKFFAIKIIQNAQKKTERIMGEVFPGASEFEPILKVFESSNPSIVLDQGYVAKNGDEVLGAVIQVEGPTHSRGRIIVGVNKNGTISAMRFIELTDTAGFGQKACDPTFKMPSGLTFYEQFSGKDGNQTFKAGVNYDAISGSTITCRRVGDLVQEGCQALIGYLGEANE